MKKDSTAKYIIFVMCIVVLIFSACKKKKGIDSTEWKDESLKITAKLCEKYRACADEKWEGIPEKLKDFTKSRLEEAHCQKKFRESNVYRLIGGDPKIIITSYRECQIKILASSCETLRSGFIDTVPECVSIKKIQSGI
jgi:hypothetical protein